METWGPVGEAERSRGACHVVVLLCVSCARRTKGKVVTASRRQRQGHGDSVGRREGASEAAASGCLGTEGAAQGSTSVKQRRPLPAAAATRLKLGVQRTLVWGATYGVFVQQ